MTNKGENETQPEQLSEHDKILHQRGSLVTRMNRWINFVNLAEFLEMDLHETKARINRGAEMFHTLEQAQLHMLNQTVNQAERDIFDNELMEIDVTLLE